MLTHSFRGLGQVNIMMRKGNPVSSRAGEVALQRNPSYSGLLSYQWLLSLVAQIELRIVAALLENHQDHDGVAMPKALVPYVGFERIDA